MNIKNRLKQELELLNEEKKAKFYTYLKKVLFGVEPLNLLPS